MVTKRNGFYYIDQEHIYPAVTNIISIIDKPQLMHWAAQQSARAALANPELSEQEAISVIYSKKDKAGERGKIVHSMVEAFANGNDINISTMPENLQGYAKAFQNFVKEFNPKVISSEQTVYSHKYKYAGTLDLIVEDQAGKIWLIDVKTSSGIYPEMGLQLKAYKQAVEEMQDVKIDVMAVLQLKEDGTKCLQEMDAPLEVFLACRAVWMWKNPDKINGSIPKAKKQKKGGEENGSV